MVFEAVRPLAPQERVLDMRGLRRSRWVARTRGSCISRVASINKSGWSPQESAACSRWWTYFFRLGSMTETSASTRPLNTRATLTRKISLVPAL